MQVLEKVPLPYKSNSASPMLVVTTEDAPPGQSPNAFTSGGRRATRQVTDERASFEGFWDGYTNGNSKN